MFNITVGRKSNRKAFDTSLKQVEKLAAYVGIPSTTAKKRSEQLLKMAGKSTTKRRKLEKAAKTDINNAELLFVFSKGSPRRSQPPRPVLEPAVEADAEVIAKPIAASVAANLRGDNQTALLEMNKAALTGQNSARGWFTDKRNNWAPNAPSTIKAKGSDRPGIDSGAMRNAIIGVVDKGD